MTNDVLLMSCTRTDAGVVGRPPFNSWIISYCRLSDRLGEHNGNRQPTAAMLQVFPARRQGGRFFAPDFQAQLIEEVGADYFRVWQSIDTDVDGPHTRWLGRAGLPRLQFSGHPKARNRVTELTFLEPDQNLRGQHSDGSTAVFHEPHSRELTEKPITTTTCWIHSVSNTHPTRGRRQANVHRRIYRGVRGL